MHPLYKNRSKSAGTAKTEDRTARNVLTRRGGRFFSSLTGTTTAIDSPHPPTGSSKASEGLKPTAAAEEERRASCARQEEQRPASCAGQEEQRPASCAGQEEQRRATCARQKEHSPNTSQQRRGARRAPFRLSGPGHCIVQDRKSSRAMRGLSSPRCAWTGKDRRVVGDGSVTRRTFAPLRRASFRLVLHLHFCGQDRKSSRAMRGLCSPRLAWTVFFAARHAALIRRRVVFSFRALLSIVSHTCQGWFRRSIA